VGGQQVKGVLHVDELLLDGAVCSATFVSASSDHYNVSTCLSSCVHSTCPASMKAVFSASWACNGARCAYGQEATQSAVLIYNKGPAGRTVGAEVVERRIQLLHERDEEHRVSDGQPPLSHALRRARLRDAPRRLAH